MMTAQSLARACSVEESKYIPRPRRGTSYIVARLKWFISLFAFFVVSTAIVCFSDDLVMLLVSFLAGGYNSELIFNLRV
jgi:hypothetical protein